MENGESQPKSIDSAYRAKFYRGVTEKSGAHPSVRFFNSIYQFYLAQYIFVISHFLYCIIYTIIYIVLTP